MSLDQTRKIDVDHKELHEFVCKVLLQSEASHPSMLCNANYTAFARAPVLLLLILKAIIPLVLIDTRRVFSYPTTWYQVRTSQADNIIPVWSPMRISNDSYSTGQSATHNLSTAAYWCSYMIRIRISIYENQSRRKIKTYCCTCT